MRKRRRIAIFFATAFIFVLLPGTVFTLQAASDDIIVIANKNVPETMLTPGDVKSIFLGEKSQWSNGRKIFFVLLKDYEVHNKFLAEFINKSVTQYNNHWKKLVFIGRGRTPTFFNSADQIIDYVSSVEGAIGYIPASRMDKNRVKPISIAN